MGTDGFEFVEYAAPDPARSASSSKPWVSNDREAPPQERDAVSAGSSPAPADLQDRTGGFTAFIAWTFQPTNTAMAATSYLVPVPAHPGVARVMLDNFPSVQASWVTQGGKSARSRSASARTTSAA